MLDAGPRTFCHVAIFMIIIWNVEMYLTIKNIIGRNSCKGTCHLIIQMCPVALQPFDHGVVVYS